ncbi:hypothetical protein KAI87_05975, partial [Myxococcota bacterium]|nr:hypothetical protein [Myxococcota bacterium]
LSEVMERYLDDKHFIARVVANQPWLNISEEEYKEKSEKVFADVLRRLKARYLDQDLKQKKHELAMAESQARESGASESLEENIVNLAIQVKNINRKKRQLERS